MGDQVRGEEIALIVSALRLAAKSENIFAGHFAQADPDKAEMHRVKSKKLRVLAKRLESFTVATGIHLSRVVS